MLFVTHQQLKSRRRTNLEIVSVTLLLGQCFYYELSHQDQEETIYGKMQKKPKQGQKGVLQSKNQRQTEIIKTLSFGCCFLTGRNLLSLYNAVNQTDYRNPEELEIVTLEDTIYMGMKNDLAFIMDTNLYLYEHQSTYNPNMPLRDLFYICSEYQKLVDKKSLFSSTLQKIPAPILLNFIMVRWELLIAQNFSFPRHLSICQASQNLNWLLRFSMSMKDTMQS